MDLMVVDAAVVVAAFVVAVFVATDGSGMKNKALACS
jgi:hypothetical protein